MHLIYVAAKFSGLQSNADRAEKITAALNRHIEGAIFIAPWLPMVRHWVDSGDSRARGIALDLEAVKKCDALIAVSPLEGGVRLEWDLAKNKLNASVHGDAFDTFGDLDGYAIDQIQDWVDDLGAF